MCPDGTDSRFLELPWNLWFFLQFYEVPNDLLINTLLCLSWFDLGFYDSSLRFWTGTEGTHPWLLQF